MTRSLVCAAMSLGLAAAAAFGQQKQPHPKSQAEVTALQAMFNATNVDEQIAAANNVLEKFADTEFKGIALEVIAADYQRKNDFAKAVTYAERALEADPKNIEAMLVLAGQYAINTHDTDFDKEDKLKNAEKYANQAIATIQTAEKPSPQATDDQWNAQKKDWLSAAHESLGQVAMVRKKPDDAVTEFKIAVDTAATPEAPDYVRLAQADNMVHKYDDAIAAAEKAMALPNASPTVKQIAQAERARAMMNKNKAAGTPAPAAPNAPATPPATPPQN
jgi:tetratricopeptide (TPR) repeat protein